MSIIINFAPIVEMMLTIIYVISAVGVLQSSGLFMQSPPSASCVHSLSVLFGFMLQLKLPYIKLLILSFGTLSFLMKNILFVLIILSLTLCASLPNLFAAHLDHVSLCLGSFSSWC
jgi:hypothetical protein